MVKIVIFILFLGFSTGNSVPADIHGASKPKADPIIPPLPPVLPIANSTIDLEDLSLPGLKGVLSLWSGVVTGLDTLVDSGINITAAPIVPGQPLRQRVRFTVDIANVAITGVYAANVELGLSEMFPQLLAVTNLTGDGKLYGNLTNGKLEIEVFVIPLSRQIPGEIGTMVSLNNLTITPQFDAAVVNIENAAVNGAPIDWDEFNLAIKIIFELVWGQIKGPLSDYIVNLANEIVKDCTIIDFIGIIGGGSADCLNLPTLPTTPSGTDATTPGGTDATTPGGTDATTPGGTDATTPSAAIKLSNPLFVFHFLTIISFVSYFGFLH